MKKGDLKNFESHANPEIGISQTVIDLIVALVLDSINLQTEVTEIGTFILCGQKWGYKSEPILRFDLSEKDDNGDADYWRNIANGIMNISPVNKDDNPSNYIGTINGGSYLQLNATHGRFLCCFCAEYDEENNISKQCILAHLAEGLTQICVEDKILWTSAIHAIGSSNIEDSVRHGFLRKSFIREHNNLLFNNRSLPEIKIWKEECDSIPQLLFFKSKDDEPATCLGLDFMDNHGKELFDFIYRAAQHGYGSTDAIASRDEFDGSTTIEWTDDDWRYLDKYYGGEPFSGMTVIFYKGIACWTMAYRGTLAYSGYKDAAYSVLGAALLLTPKDYPFRGPSRYDGENGISYYNNLQNYNNVQFWGTEFINDGPGNCIYKADYSCGLVNILLAK